MFGIGVKISWIRFMTKTDTTKWTHTEIEGTGCLVVLRDHIFFDSYQELDGPFHHFPPHVMMPSLVPYPQIQNTHSHNSQVNQTSLSSHFSELVRTKKENSKLKSGTQKCDKQNPLLLTRFYRWLKTKIQGRKLKLKLKLKLIHKLILVNS